MNKILLVDDDPGVLDVVAFMLRREGFEVDNVLGTITWGKGNAAGLAKVRSGSG